MYSQKQQRWIILYLIISMPISGASVDIYVPSLPAMTTFFGVDATMTQLTITFFLLGYGLLSLLFGPLSDSIGRKPPLIFGAVVYILSALLITQTASIHTLLLLRFIQGVGVAAIAGVSRTITPDVFQGEKYLHVTNMTTVAWSVGPIVAPFIGGYFQHYLSWKWCFYSLMLYGIIQLILMVLVLPETLTEKKPFSLTELHSRIKTLLTTPLFIGSTLISAFVYSCIIVFNTMGPFLIQEVLGKTSIFYGYMALLMGTAFFIGNMLNKRLINYKATPRLDFALAIMFIAIFLECICLFIFPVNIYNIMIPTLLIILASGVFFPNSYGTALRLYPEFSGMASAILSAAFISTTSLVSGISSTLKTHNQVDFTILFTGIIALLAISYWTLFREKKHLIQ